MSEWKIYVWDAFLPDYTEGLAVAVARSLDEAIASLSDDDYVLTEARAKTPEIHEIGEKPFGIYVCGGS